MDDLGYLKGEICNRGGCLGIIEEHELDGGCSCHINPPCSYCTTSREYCPECDWDGREEQVKLKKEQSKKRTAIEFYKVRTISDLDRNKIDYLNLAHTNFSMIKKGVFPKGTTIDEVRERVKGSFGGRFKIFDEDRCEFEYVAYTD